MEHLNCIISCTKNIQYVGSKSMSDGCGSANLANNIYGLGCETYLPFIEDSMEVTELFDQVHINQ